METAPRPFVFVLMPFSKDFDDIYQLGIRAACEEAGAYCERVDEQIYTENILERVYNQIAKADILVADMSGRNPNVFYETGYAHALGKKPILLTASSDDIPFDLKHYPHIVYDKKISLLKVELQKRIRWSIDNPSITLEVAEPTLKFYIGGQDLAGRPAVDVQMGYINYLPNVELKIDIQNSSTVTVAGSNIRLGLVVNPAFNAASGDVLVSKLPNGDSMYLLPSFESIFPTGWAVIRTNLRMDIAENILTFQQCVLRVFTKIGSTDLPFTAILRR
jgi:hypothetical protein